VIRAPIFVFTIAAGSGHGIRERGSLPAHGVTASRTPGAHPVDMDVAETRGGFAL
jgi:hypothetical protein